MSVFQGHQVSIYIKIKSKTTQPNRLWRRRKIVGHKRKHMIPWNWVHIRLHLSRNDLLQNLFIDISFLHQDTVTSAVFVPNSDLIVSGSDDRLVKIKIREASLLHIGLIFRKFPSGLWPTTLRNFHPFYRKEASFRWGGDTFYVENISLSKILIFHTFCNNYFWHSILGFILFLKSRIELFHQLCVLWNRNDSTKKGRWI